jgi:hypothetical protein
MSVGDRRAAEFYSREDGRNFSLRDGSPQHKHLKYVYCFENFTLLGCYAAKDWQLVTDVSGKLIGPTSKVMQIKYRT